MISITRDGEQFAENAVHLALLVTITMPGDGSAALSIVVVIEVMRGACLVQRSTAETVERRLIGTEIIAGRLVKNTRKCPTPPATAARQSLAM